MSANANIRHPMAISALGEDCFVIDQRCLVNFAERSQDMANPIRPEPPLGVIRAGGFAHNQG
jgi:hypothetical protein